MDNIEKINNSIMQKKFDSLKRKMRKSAEDHSKYIIFNLSQNTLSNFFIPRNDRNKGGSVNDFRNN